MHHLLQGFGWIAKPDMLASLRSREWGSSSGLSDVTADFFIFLFFQVALSVNSVFALNVWWIRAPI